VDELTRTELQGKDCEATAVFLANPESKFAPSSWQLFAMKGKGAGDRLAETITRINSPKPNGRSGQT